MSGDIRSLGARFGIDLSPYNSAISELYAKQKNVESSFRSSANQMQNWQGSSAGLAMRVSSLNDKIAIQRQVLDNLKTAFNNVASTEEGKNSPSAAKLDSMYVQASKTLDSMNKELMTYREQLYNVAMAEGKTADQAAAMGGQLKNTETRTQSFGSQIKELASNKLMQFASASFLVQQGLQLIGDAAKAAWESLQKAAKAMDDLKTKSEQTGIATRTLQEMKYASAALDVELETQTAGLSRVVKAIGAAKSANKDYIDVTDRVKVSIKDASGQLKDSEEIYYNVIDAIKSISNETDREVAAQKIFGKSYQDIMPLVNAGTEALKKYSQEAHKAGAVVDDVTVSALARLNDRFDEITQSTEANTARMLASMGPLAEKIKELESTDWLITAAYTTSRMILTTAGWTKTQIENLDALSVAQYASGMSAEEFGKALEGVTNYLISKGIPKLLAAKMALNVVAQGYDAVSYSAKLTQNVVDGLHAKVEAAETAWKDSMKEWQDAVQDTTKTMMDNFGGMFDGIPKQAKTSIKAMIKQLKKDVETEAQFEANLQILSGKGFSTEMITQMRESGQYQNVAALAKGSDSQIAEWLSLYNQKKGISVQAALMQNKPLELDAAAARSEYYISLDKEKAGTEAAKQKYSTIDPTSISELVSAINGGLSKLKTTFNLDVSLNADGQQIVSGFLQLVKTANLNNGTTQ